MNQTVPTAERKCDTHPPEGSQKSIDSSTLSS